MRVVTLDGLGAVAPIVPMGAPQYYGISGGLGVMTPTESRYAITSGSIGFVLGCLTTYLVLRRKRKA